LTERLYYHDSFLKTFDATVTRCEPESRPGGSRWKVTLDRTGFYPTSGGQPHDLGTLGNAPVIEVADAEDHVVHYTSAEVPVGPVKGTIDWARRFDHMQQHTAQHLLSAAFIELYKMQTISFHLGEEICTIDLATPSLAQSQLDAAERRTNEIIFEDRIVEVRFGTADELAEVGVRKNVDREGILRAIRIAEFDFQPCGGTHLSRTGQAGMILLRRFEKRRDAFRVEFVAGGRALASAKREHALLLEAATTLTCGLPEVPAGVVKLAEERRAANAALKDLEDKYADTEAARLLAESAASSSNNTRVVSATLRATSPTYTSLLAAKIVGHTSAAGFSVVAILANEIGGQVAVAQTKGGPLDLSAVLRDVLAQVQGKGGGRRDFAQATLTNPAQAAQFVSSATQRISAAGTASAGS
jgi:alanyl-tRNA synthetase